MKNLIKVMLSCFLLFSMFLPINAENNTSEIEFKPYSFSDNLENNKTAFNKYSEYCKKTEYNSYHQLETNNKVMNDQLSNNEKELLDNEFYPLQLIEKDPEMKVIEEEINGTITSEILYDTANNIYYYLEANGNTNNLLFYINNQKYILQAENGNYLLLSENGEKLTFIESSSLPEFAPKSLIQPRASWILLGNNMHKTNKAWVTVLSIISTVVGGGSLIKGAHPIIGTISFITSLIATVGDQIFVTLYIVFSQSYRSDCTSYIKEVDDYYQYSNYTGYLKSQTIYFHSERPDYAGQNCLAYN